MDRMRENRGPHKWSGDVTHSVLVYDKGKEKVCRRTHPPFHIFAVHFSWSKFKIREY